MQGDGKPSTANEASEADFCQGSQNTTYRMLCPSATSCSISQARYVSNPTMKSKTKTEIIEDSSLQILYREKHACIFLCQSGFICKCIYK